MSATLERSYQPLQPYGPELGEADETPQDSGVMIHVVPENSRARWNHVEDLDSFFTRMYHYHQKHGFTCMILQEILELLQFIFVVMFSTFLLHCVDYSVLFRDNVNATAHQKISLSDAVLPTSECIANLGALTWVCILVAVIFWALRAIKVIYHLFQFWDIKQFFNTALKINDSDLDNLTWHEIQRRVREVQLEQQMCIHKSDLTELDIYHRILRFKNYMVAMVNKSLLPVRLHLPLLGEIVFLTRGLKYNIELLLFWGPWAPFENNWHLKEDYKKVSRRKDLAELLSKHILWVGIANFVLCPLILLWQILYSFFNYAEVIKREPGSLGSRCWSLYGRLYLRHFNELDHELNARLNRAYRPASKYMNIFTSPLMTIIAQNVAFVAGACLAVLLILSVYDEDVITVEHVLTAITVLGAVVAGSRVFIPDENLVWCPEKLLTAVLAHAHYLPDSYRGQAHTNRVREEFSQLFHYKAVYLLEELLSPVVTPFILCFHLRSKSLDIVDFYRNFTVEVVGVGDVCSFAQMDVRRHGNPAWQTSVTSPVKPQPSGPGDAIKAGMHTVANQYTQAEDGKTELSLVHFTLTNPEWQPPTDAEDFVTALRTQARRDANQLLSTAGVGAVNPLYSSLHSVSSLGAGFSSLVASIFRGNTAAMAAGGLMDSSVGMMPLFSAGAVQSNLGSGERAPGLCEPMVPAPTVRGGLSRAEGPIHSSERGLLYSLQQGLPSSSLAASVFAPVPDMAPETDPLEFTAADMSLSTLYLHELHHRQVRRRGYQESSLNRSAWQRPHQDMPGIRELGDESGELTRHAERTPLLDTATKPTRTS
ncbi:Autophagy-related protein 9A [Cryptotermes secundus]|uniref:Autophagy-related protein 9 n=2 Tax=Cryptotermes secundus TaxID=105785 RepID=A0A2J7QHY6_9NEOP|nr:autophagy-related protein 9A isoform X2 [Cryptotermes secundus]PNF28200.1 Autophagy-related protein 9A [Cryptotermes secundus]